MGINGTGSVASHGTTATPASAASAPINLNVTTTPTATIQVASVVDTAHIPAMPVPVVVTAVGTTPQAASAVQVVVAHAQQMPDSAKIILATDCATVWAHVANEKIWNDPNDLVYYTSEKGLSEDTLDCLSVEEVNDMASFMKELHGRKFLKFFKI